MHLLQTVNQSKISNARTGFLITRKFIPFKQASVDAGFQLINNNNNHRIQTTSAHSIQINITRPDDPSEEEADRIAEEIMHSSESESVHHHPPSEAKINRKCKSCEEEEEVEKMMVKRKTSHEMSYDLELSENIVQQVDNTLHQESCIFSKRKRKVFRNGRSVNLQN
jgi:hypothetical protein